MSLSSSIGDCTLEAVVLCSVIEVGVEVIKLSSASFWDDEKLGEDAEGRGVLTKEVGEVNSGSRLRIGCSVRRLSLNSGTGILGVGFLWGSKERSKRMRPPLPRRARPRNGLDSRDIRMCPSIRRGKN